MSEHSLLLLTPIWHTVFILIRDFKSLQQISVQEVHILQTVSSMVTCFYETWAWTCLGMSLRRIWKCKVSPGSSAFSIVASALMVSSTQLLWSALPSQTARETWGFRSCYKRTGSSFSSLRRAIYHGKNILPIVIICSLLCCNETITCVQNQYWFNGEAEQHIALGKINTTNKMKESLTGCCPQHFQIQKNFPES